MLRKASNNPIDEQLAIDGGRPAFPQGPPDWPLTDKGIREAVAGALKDGSWGRYHGPHCESLIEKLKELHDVDHALLCCSGTYAVEAALRGLGVEPGDEVILAAYEFPGNFRAIEAVGARPVLVDIDPDNWSLDPEHVSAAASDKTRAVIASHLHGGMVPMRRLVQIATEHNLGIVEDACQATGAMIEGRIAGTWGDVGVISFGGSKLLTAGRGGALLTYREDVYQRAKIYGHRGNDAFPLSELQAAVLEPQVDQLAERNDKRRKNAQLLLQELTDLTELRPPVSRAVAVDPSFYKIAWELSLENRDRDEFIRVIQAEGVAVDAAFRGFAHRSDRRCRKVGALEHSQRAAENTVLLHHPILLRDRRTIMRLAEALRKVVSHLARPS